MANRLNKKVLCFVDEHGTAGVADFSFGVLLVFARDAGRIDKRFSDCLESTAAEIRASNLSDTYMHGLLQRFRVAQSSESLMMLNRKVTARGDDAPQIYAEALIETVKIGLKQFRRDVMKTKSIGNIEVIIDANHHNTHPTFGAKIHAAQQYDGMFRGVVRVVPLDSAASRLLQLADVVAHSRKWLQERDTNAAQFRERFGIHIAA